MNPYGTSPGVEDLQRAGAGALGCSFAIALVMVAFMIWLFWRILTKAGFSGWIALLNLIPFGTFVILLILAFGNWPALQSNEAGFIAPRAPEPPQGYSPQQYQQQQQQQQPPQPPQPYNPHQPLQQEQQPRPDYPPQPAPYEPPTQRDDEPPA